MRAFVCDSTHRPSRLPDIPTPQAGPGEVLVAVVAAGVNSPDNLMIVGR